MVDVPDAEAQFHAHEFLDVAVQPKPIFITPNEVYSMHSILSENLQKLVSVNQSLDPGWEVHGYGL